MIQNSTHRNIGKRVYSCSIADGVTVGMPIHWPAGLGQYYAVKQQKDYDYNGKYKDMEGELCCNIICNKINVAQNKSYL